MNPCESGHLNQLHYTICGLFMSSATLVPIQLRFHGIQSYRFGLDFYPLLMAEESKLC